MSKIESSVVASTSATAGATGIVVEYGSLLIIDPILIVLGLIGFIAAYFRYPNHTVANRVSGFIVGILLANFSSMGLSEFATNHGISFLNPHIAAVLFGFSGASVIDLWEKWLSSKGREFTDSNVKRKESKVRLDELPITSLEEEDIDYYDR